MNDANDGTPTVASLAVGAKTLLLSICLSAVPISSQAHEFWIQPQVFCLNSGDSLTAELRNGEGFEGFTFPYTPTHLAQFSIANGDDIRAVNSQPGADPAMDSTPLQDGLNVLLYESTGSAHTHETFLEFETFLKEVGAEWAAIEHTKRGLPRSSVTEVYVRYAKSLVSVEPGGGRDKAHGMELELVALNRPYGIPRQETDVQLLLKGQPLADTLVSIFYRSDDEDVSITYKTTDAEGKVSVDDDQQGVYMISAVHLRPPSPFRMAQTGAVWESLWASLSFERSEEMC